MFVVLYSKDKRQKTQNNKDKETSKDRVQRENKKIPPEAWIFCVVCCRVVTRGQSNKGGTQRIKTTEREKIQLKAWTCVCFVTFVLCK